MRWWLKPAFSSSLSSSGQGVNSQALATRSAACCWIPRTSREEGTSARRKRTWPPQLKIHPIRIRRLPRPDALGEQPERVYSRTLGDFHRQVLDMAETDSASAVMLYVKDYPDIRDKRSKLFTDLTMRSSACERRGERGEWLALGSAWHPHPHHPVGDPDRRPRPFLDRHPAAESPGRRPRTHAPGGLHRAPGLQRRDEFGILGTASTGWRTTSPNWSARSSVRAFKSTPPRPRLPRRPGNSRAPPTKSPPRRRRSAPPPSKSPPPPRSW
jgi:hypothetical protein